MTAQVIAIRATASSSTGWSSQELAEVFRLGDMLHRHGVDLAISYGVSDEGDPWLVLSDPLDAEISFHIARIDQSYVIARGDSDEVTVKRHLREVAEALLPSRASEDLIIGSEKEPLELYAVVALAIASSESFAQAPALKQALEAAALGERTASARNGQRETDDRIGELARILIAAANAGESDAGRAALAAAQLPSLAAPALSQPAPQAIQNGMQPLQRLALTVSVELGQAIAPGQRDLAPAHSMIAGLAAGTIANWLDSSQETAAVPVGVALPATPALDLPRMLIKLAAGMELGGPPGALPSAPDQLAMPMPVTDVILAGELSGPGRDIAGVPADGPRTVQILQAQTQTFDFSSESGVRVSVVDSSTTILGSHGFDLITVSGHNLVRIGDGGAIVTVTAGDNIIIGSSAASTVNIAGGSNSIAGGSGTQTVNIQQGHNTVSGGSGTQVVNIAGGDNTVVGGSGGTVVNVGGGTNSITGGSGNDTINVHDGVNTVSGGGGNTLINIGGGQTTVNPGGGHDSISIGPGSSIVGTTGASPIIGAAPGTSTTTIVGAAADSGISVVGSASSTHDAASLHTTT